MKEPLVWGNKKFLDIIRYGFLIKVKLGLACTRNGGKIKIFYELIYVGLLLISRGVFRLFKGNK